MTDPCVPPAVQDENAVAAGAYVQANGRYAPSDPKVMDWYAEIVGREPSVIMWYQDWIHGPEFPAACAKYVRERGATPMITWEPWDSTPGASVPPAFSPKRLAGGEHDEYVRLWAERAQAYGHPIFLRFAHEMNGDWYPWGAQPGNAFGTTPADYIRAWRHLHEIFSMAGALNVRWVWSPNIAYPGAAPFASVYPGDDYVDWVGLDGYNSTVAGRNVWRGLASLFAPSYDALSALTDKPILIAETACGERGGSKAGWIRDAYVRDIPSRLPRVRAIIWFDENKEDTWSVTSSPSALAAYRDAMSLPRYHGRLL